MQVERLAVGIAARGLPHLDEFLDLGMRDREIDRGRAAPQRALRDRERQAVHHADEGDDARGLAVLPDLLADRAQIAPVAADAAALGGEPDILVPEPDDALETVGGLVEEAGDRQAAVGAAIGQHGRRRHEPEPADIVVEALRVAGIVAVIAGDAREQILVALARQQVAVIQGGAAEFGQQRVARTIHANLMATLHLHCVEHRRPLQNLCLHHRHLPAAPRRAVKPGHKIWGLVAGMLQDAASEASWRACSREKCARRSYPAADSAIIGPRATPPKLRRSALASPGRDAISDHVAPTAPRSRCRYPPPPNAASCTSATSCCAATSARTGCSTSRPTLADTKTYGFDNEDRGRIEPGEKLHGMAMRLTVDEAMEIVACRGRHRFRPLRDLPGRRRQFRPPRRPHHRPRLPPRARPSASAAPRAAPICASSSSRWRPSPCRRSCPSSPAAARAIADGSPPKGIALLNSCTAYASDSPVVKRRWPEKYTGP